MSKWADLSPDMKMCVTIFNEQKQGRDVWTGRLWELLKHELTRLDISKNEDRLMDLGFLDKQWKDVDGKWTYCYRLCKCTEFLVRNVAENVRRET